MTLECVLIPPALDMKFHEQMPPLLEQAEHIFVVHVDDLLKSRMCRLNQTDFNANILYANEC